MSIKDLTLISNVDKFSKEDEKDFWKAINRAKRYDIKVSFRFLKEAVEGAKTCEDFSDFCVRGFGRVPCLDWKRDISEAEYYKLKRVRHSEGDLQAYAELLWHALNEDEFNHQFRGGRTDAAEKELRNFLNG